MNFLVYAQVVAKFTLVTTICVSFVPQKCLHFSATRAPTPSPHTLGLAPSSHTAYFSTSLHRMGGGSVGDGGESVMTPELKEKIDKMVQESDVVVFMKVCGGRRILHLIQLRLKFLGSTI